MNDCILLKDGFIVDTKDDRYEQANIIIENGLIKHIGKSYKKKKFDEVYNCKGLYISAGFIDIHMHCREPGYENKESLKETLLSAVAGGFTSIVSMPNTKPVIDNVDTLVYLKNKASKIGLANLFIASAITLSEKGETIAPLKDLSNNGAIAFSDNGNCIQKARIMFEALKIAKTLAKPIISHCEDYSISMGGYINEGVISKKYKLLGKPSIAEDAIVYRDLAIAHYIKAPIHITHVSTQGAVEIINLFKSKNSTADWRISCDVTPHHLLLTEDEISCLDANFKMNPPLRTKKDREALLAALKNNIIDAIASDHAPHSVEEKSVSFEEAPFGVVGLQTTFPVILTKLVHTGEISLSSFIRKITIEPARILKLNKKGVLEIGKDADLTVFDLNHSWRIEASKFLSRARNTPFDNWRVKGKVIYTFVGGKRVYPL